MTGTDGAILVLDDDVAGIGQPRLLRDRQRIQFGAQQHRLARPVLQYRDNAGAPDAGGDLEAERAELGGQLGGGVRFMQ